MLPALSPRIASPAAGQMEQPVRFTRFAVDRFTVALDDRENVFRPGVRCIVRPLLPGGSFDVNAEVLSRSPTGEDGAAIVLSAEFTPELVEMVDGFFFGQGPQAVKWPA